MALRGGSRWAARGGAPAGRETWRNRARANRLPGCRAARLPADEKVRCGPMRGQQSGADAGHPVEPIEGRRTAPGSRDPRRWPWQAPDLPAGGGRARRRWPGRRLSARPGRGGGRVRGRCPGGPAETWAGVPPEARSAPAASPGRVAHQRTPLAGEPEGQQEQERAALGGRHGTMLSRAVLWEGSGNARTGAIRLVAPTWIPIILEAARREGAPDGCGEAWVELPPAFSPHQPHRHVADDLKALAAHLVDRIERACAGPDSRSPPRRWRGSRPSAARGDRR